ncbi:MAG: PepSY-like domain-containing protein, partial [Planctomycetota bacterium]
MHIGFENLRFTVIVAVLVLCGVSSGKDVSLSEVPQAVRVTIERELKGMEIDDIERDEDDGKIVYEVETDGDADIKIKIAEDGTLLQKEEELDTEDVPAPILNAVKEMFGDVDFEDVEKEYRSDRGTIYKIEVEKDRLRIDLEMKEDGTVVKKRVRDNGDDMPGSLRKVRRKFMPLRGQLKVVVIGDSRAEKGVDPRYFLGEENQKHPIAFSFGACTRGMAMAQLLCEDYFAHGSKMEWVIYGVSTRVFNTYYTPGNNEDDIKESRGYLADKAAWATLPEIKELVPFSDVDT